MESKNKYNIFMHGLGFNSRHFGSFILLCSGQIQLLNNSPNYKVQINELKNCINRKFALVELDGSVVVKYATIVRTIATMDDSEIKFLIDFTVEK